MSFKDEKKMMEELKKDALNDTVLEQLSDDEDDDDDEIIATYDVYAAQNLQGNLHLFQYPLRPSYRPYEMKEGCVELNVQTPPKQASDSSLGGVHHQGVGGTSGDQIVNENSRISMEISMDIEDHMSFCSVDERLQQRGEAPIHTAAGTANRLKRGTTSGRGVIKDEDLGDDDEAGDGSERQRASMNTFRYQLLSSPFVSKSNYAAAIIRGDEIHLTPLASVQQFVPVVSNPAATNGGRSPPTQVQRARSDPCRPVSQEFSSSLAEDGSATGNLLKGVLSRQLGKLRSVMLNSQAAGAKPLEYYGPESIESRTVAKRLFCSTVTASKNMFAEQIKRRLGVQDAFFPVERYFHDGGKDALSSGGTLVRKNIVNRYAAFHSFADQVKDLMLNCQVATLSMLKESIKYPDGLTPTTDDIVKQVRRCAVYTHGVWIALGNPKFKDTMAALREVIILNFHKSDDGCLSRKAINDLFTIRNPVLRTNIKHILETLATLDMTPPPEQRRWRLFHTNDASLITDMQEMETVCAEDTRAQKAFWLARVENINKVVYTINSGGGIASRNLLFVQHSGGAASAASPRGGVANASPSVDRQAGGGRVGTAGGNSNEDQVNKVCRAVRELFKPYGVINKQLSKNRLLLMTRDVSSSIYGVDTASLGIGMQREVMAFTASSFTLKLLHDERDQYRQLFIEAMREMQQFSSKDLVAKVSELGKRRLEAEGQTVPAGGLQVPASIAERIISELAEYLSGERLWHLKTGIVSF